MIRLLDRDRGRFGVAMERLNALNPLAVLERGYSALLSEEGEVISRAEQLTEGQDVILRMADGHAKARILQRTLKDER
jgi:exodeoxyribonuclease VII large subunit